MSHVLRHSDAFSPRQSMGITAPQRQQNAASARCGLALQVPHTLEVSSQPESKKKTCMNQLALARKGQQTLQTPLNILDLPTKTFEHPLELSWISFRCLLDMNASASLLSWMGKTAAPARMEAATTSRPCAVMGVMSPKPTVVSVVSPK